jgi:hypothetical protein
MSATWISIGRKKGETDEEWAAACKDMARALAEAWGMEHLLPASGMSAFGQDPKGLEAKPASPTRTNSEGDAQ